MNTLLKAATISLALFVIAGCHPKNRNNAVDAHPVHPENSFTNTFIEGKTYSVKINKSQWFSNDENEYSILFDKHQKIYKIKDHIKYFVSNGGYSFESYENAIFLNIVDSRFGEGIISMRFNEGSTVSGKFKIEKTTVKGTTRILFQQGDFFLSHKG